MKAGLEDKKNASHFLYHKGKNAYKFPYDEKKNELLKISEISLWLDTYDDIFSDFDPRSYSERAVSDDFLLEIKRASRDKPSGIIELKFLTPADKRNGQQEALIKKRLKEHFSKHFHLLKKEVKNTIREGLILTLFGIIFMFLATVILFKYPEKNMLVSFLIVLLEPAGWFMFWEGLNMALFKKKEEKTNLKFYEKMSKCEVSFISY